MGALNDFQSGFREGQAGKYSMAVAVVLIVAALYFFQKWTGVPVLDWVERALDWFFGKLWYLVGIILN